MVAEKCPVMKSGSLRPKQLTMVFLEEVLASVGKADLRVNSYGGIHLLVE